MPRLFKISFILISFCFILSAPALAQSCGQAPQPNSPAIDLIIKEAQKLGGAAAQVPLSVLKAIYWIEGTEAYAPNPAPYMVACKKRNPPGDTGLGWLQITDEMYQKLVPKTEQMSNEEGSCTDTSCQLSRCKPVDAFEIAARVLLYKIGLWNEQKYEAKGKITTLSQVYNASCYYYGGGGLGGPFDPNDITNGLSGYLSYLPPDGQLSYCEFVCAMSGFCKSTSSFPWPRGPQSTGGSGQADWKYQACITPITSPIPTNFKVHPLRPFPEKPTPADPPLTPYCAMRPVAVEQNRLDKREEFIDLQTVGELTQDFTRFITPLLSITDPKKPDYQLPYNQKAQRYLADFLEGRAYYEPFPEPVNPTFSQQQDIFNRMGVFRKLAPASYQNQLKKAVIFRAANAFTQMENPYGFAPASETINNYTVSSWQGKTVTLQDYYNNNAWAPLEDDWKTNWPTATNLTDAHEQWATASAGKWFSLWPYVPLFTREDAEGYIQIVDDNPPPPPYSPTGQWEEKNTSTSKKVTVSHPHLARTYEVSTSLSYLLFPYATQSAQPATPKEEWTIKPWDNNVTWLDPSYMRPHTDPPPLGIGVEVGPVCFLDSRYTQSITSSGDQALDSNFSTNTWRKDLNIPAAQYGGFQYDPSQQTDSCIDSNGQPRTITHYTCEVLDFKDCSIDESDCFYYKEIRYTPTYLITYTPFLNEIYTSLTQSSRGIFDIFRPADTELKPDEEYDWPGQGNAGEESPVYDFFPASKEQGWAEAGYRQPGDSQSYYYRYLGSIQCAKERVLQVLQPFISGESYKPYAYSCFPELTPPTASAPPTPTGPRWLVWPMKNVQHPLIQCFKASGTHAGLDMISTPDAAPVYPGASGTVIKVSFSSVFGHYVIINHAPHHSNYSTIYAHLQPNILVSDGDSVDTNKILGYQDSSGTSAFYPTMPLHLHMGLATGSNESDFYFTSSKIEDPCAAIEGCTCP